MFGREIRVEVSLVVEVDEESEAIKRTFDNDHDITDFLRKIGESYALGQITANPNQYIKGVGTVRETGARFIIYKVDSVSGSKASFDSVAQQMAEEIEQFP